MLRLEKKPNETGEGQLLVRDLFDGSLETLGEFRYVPFPAGSGSRPDFRPPWPVATVGIYAALRLLRDQLS